MARYKNHEWNIPEHRNTWENVPIYLLMDIRDELQALNRVFACRNVQHGFSALRRIARLNEIAFKRRVDAAARKRVKRAARKQ